MACSYWLYIDATTEPPRIRVEATCPLSWGGRVIEPRGSNTVFETSIEHLPAAATPCRRTLPTPWPPYTAADAMIVVDSNPHVDLYGLPERKSTVISTVKRTLLEGRSYIQLIDASIGQVVGEETLMVPPDKLYWFETSTPIVSGAPHLDQVKICEQLHGGTIEAWAACLDQARLGKLHVIEMLEAASHDPGCGQRVYAAAALRAGVTPAGISSPVSLTARPAAGGVEVRLSGVEQVTLLLSREEKDGRLVAETTVKQGVNLIEDSWSSYSVVCRECWLPLPGRG